MQVKMNEYYQDANNFFEPEQVVEVDAVLGAWLVENRKASIVEAKHLDVEPQFEQAEEPPKPQKRGRK